MTEQERIIIEALIRDFELDCTVEEFLEMSQKEQEFPTE